MIFSYISSAFNSAHSFFRPSREEEPQPSPTLKFLSEESPKTWLHYTNYSNGNVFLGFQREEDDYETPESWRKLEKDMEEKVFTPVNEKCIELAKENLHCKAGKNSIRYCSTPSHTGIVLQPRSQGKLLHDQERCQLTINRVAIEKLLEMQSQYGIEKKEVREQLQTNEINLNKYYNIHQENPT